MSYKSLYRAYRPQTFEDVSGQEAIITTLRNAIEEDKIAHAYLFCGPRGTGKTTVAKLFAKAVNCTGDHKPCEQCDNCKAIANNSHQDIIEIDAASNNGVDEVRDLIEKVKYAPVLGQYKVYIIDEVHMMTPGAFNALLKTLEEPPAHVIFILATTEPHKILPTIISRCQRFDFTRLSEEEMISRMETVLKSENKTYEVDALSLIAKLANGGMRDALSILEQCLAYNDKNLNVDDVHSIYGIVSLSDKIDLIRVILAKNMNKALSIIEKMDNSGIDIKRLTYDLIDILKDVVIYKNTQNLNILTLLSDKYIETIVPYITSEDALMFIDILLNASEKYARSVNPQIYFELAILKLCNNDHKQIKDNTPEVKEDKVIKEEIQEPIVQEEIINEPVINEIVEEKPKFDFKQENKVELHSDSINVLEDDIMNILVQAQRTILNDIKEKWPVIKRYMANMNTAKAASMLSQGQPVAACKGGLIIAFEFMPDVNAVNFFKNYKILSSLIKDVLGDDYKFIAVENNEWLRLRNLFIEYKKSNKLPTPHEITLSHIEQYDLDKEELTDAQKFAIETFGSDIVVFEEE